MTTATATKTKTATKTAPKTPAPAPLAAKISAPLSTADRWREHLLAQRKPELPVTASVGTVTTDTTDTTPEITGVVSDAPLPADDNSDDAPLPSGLAAAQSKPAPESGNTESAGIKPTSDGRGLVLDHTTFDVTRHDGMVTILNTGTGNHRTFKIESQPTDANFAPGRRIVSLLIGPNRDCFTDWVGFGFADDFGVHVWQKKRGGDFDVLGKMLECPSRFAERGCVYMVEVACRRCGRPLSHPESITDGYGPTCREKV